ncbi:Ribbon-helix-helix protein CopG domain-containing protein, partial [Dysosmobacter welbionis]
VGGHIELLVGGGAGVDGLVVHVHDVLALLQVGVGGGVLHVAHSLALRHDLSQREEGGLQDGVGALA